MHKRYLALVLILSCLAAAALNACGAQQASATEAESTMVTTTTEEITTKIATTQATTTETTTQVVLETVPAIAADTTTRAPSTGYAQNRGWAFYQVFLHLGSKGQKYVAFDMTGVPKDSRATLERLVREYCAETGQTFMLATREELAAQGYIVSRDNIPLYSSFPDGAHYSFSGGDEAAYEGPLTIRGMKWFASLGAYGATYTIVLNGDIWEIERVEMVEER